MTTTTGGKPPPEQGNPEEPPHKPLPSLDELRARGFKVLPPSGRGYIMPVGGPPQTPSSAPRGRKQTDR